MKKLLILILAFILFGCAKQPVSVDDKGKSDASWQQFLNANKLELKPYRINLSLRFGKEGDTRRVTAILWGNDTKTLRLDVMAGVGAVIAKIFEDKEHFLVNAPRENKAYFSEGTTKPLLKVGVPVPFNLSHLASLLNGDYSGSFGTNILSYSEDDKGNKIFELAQSPNGKLIVNQQNQPIKWQEHVSNNTGWTMQIDLDDNSSPRKLTLTHSDGQKAILLVKDRETITTPFTDEQLKISIPENTDILPLSSFKTIR